MDAKKILLTIQLLCASWIWAQQANGRFVLAAAPPHDTLYYEMARTSTDTVSMAGVVKTVSGEKVPSTVALVNTVSLAEISVQTTSTNNGFKLVGIPKGTYILRATPNNFDYTTTYFFQTEYYDQARVFDLQNSIMDIQFYILKRTVTHITEQDQNFTIDPDTEIITVEGKTGGVKVFDVLGKFILDASSQPTISTTTWKAGLYFIKLGSGKTYKFYKR